MHVHLDWSSVRDQGNVWGEVSTIWSGADWRCVDLELEAGALHSDRHLQTLARVGVRTEEGGRLLDAGNHRCFEPARQQVAPHNSHQP